VDSNIKTLCVRFYLDKPLHKKAYGLISSQSEFTKSQAAINAILDYYENQIRENRLVEKIVAALSGTASKISPNVSENAKLQSDESVEIAIADIDFDFLGG
jgi:hypothetical protein